MNNRYLSKKIYFIYNKSNELSDKLTYFHEEYEILSKKDMTPQTFNYLLSFLTMIDYLDDKVDTLLNKILIFNRKSKKPIKKKQIYLLVYAKRKLKAMKNKEKYYFQ